MEEQIDLVHAHARIPAFLLGLLQRKLNFPYVTTAHWVFKTDFLLKRISNWGQATIAVSEDIKAYLIREYNLPEKQISLTINGISTERFSDKVDTLPIQKEFNISAENLHVVYISRLDTDRSLYAHYLAEVAERLANRYPNVDYVIVGGGNDFEAVNEKANAINQKLGKTIIHMTNSRTDVNAFVSLSNIFIGVSRSVLEGMAAAKPVIVAGNEGEIGIFTKEKLESAVLSNFTCRGEKIGNVESLENDLVTLLNASKGEREELGAYGKEVVLTYYSVEKMTNDCTKVYDQFLGTPERREAHV